MAEYRLADEGICTLLPEDFDFKYAIAAECSVGMASSVCYATKEVQRMWDVVASHEFPMTEAEEAFRISATQRCGKILLYPHGLPGERGGV